MRVIAGSLKGRRLKAPDWDGLRPTSDKLRETLFNILQGRIEGARVLDMFAGTGARIVVTLLHELERRGAKRGLATLCVSGGMGMALAIERIG